MSTARAKLASRATIAHLLPRRTVEHPVPSVQSLLKWPVFPSVDRRHLTSPRAWLLLNKHTSELTSPARLQTGTGWWWTWRGARSTAPAPSTTGCVLLPYPIHGSGRALSTAQIGLAAALWAPRAVPRGSRAEHPPALKGGSCGCEGGLAPCCAGSCCRAHRGGVRLFSQCTAHTTPACRACSQLHTVTAAGPC